MTQQLSTVFQPWFIQHGWKMQSIFVNGLRAPDTATKAVKKVVRWMRTQACHNADPKKPDCYMTAPDINDELVTQAVDELEYLTCHYTHHLADSLRILSLFHPSDHTKYWAYKIHYLIAEEIFHFKPETDEEFIERHKDKA